MPAGVKRLLTPVSGLFRTTDEPNLTEVTEDCDFLFVLLGCGFFGGGDALKTTRYSVTSSSPFGASGCFVFFVALRRSHRGRPADSPGLAGRTFSFARQEKDGVQVFGPARR